MTAPTEAQGRSTVGFVLLALAAVAAFVVLQALGRPRVSPPHAQPVAT